MTKINYKLLTSSTTIITGENEEYSMKTISTSSDPRIKKTVNREKHFSDIDELASEFANQLEKTISIHYRDGHIFNVTIKDFERNEPLEIEQL